MSKKVSAPVRPVAAPKKDVASFQSLHDPDTVIPNKIKATLAAMKKKGSQEWEYELDFLRLAGIAANQLTPYREQFARHIVEARPVGKGNTRGIRRAWFATVDAATKARGGQVVDEAEEA